MDKIKTFMDLVKAVYTLVPEEQAPRVICKLVASGRVRFNDPAEAERLVSAYCASITYGE